MSKIESVYIIGSLRNRPPIIAIGNALREVGIEGFDDWMSPGEEADDKWKEYEEARGNSYKTAIRQWAARHVFDFDRSHLDRCDAAILVCPAGKSCHLEAGYVVGRGKPLWILMDDPDRWDCMYQFAFLNGGDILYSVEDIVKSVREFRFKEAE